MRDPISWGVCSEGWQLRMPTFHTIVHRREKNLLSTESTRCAVRFKNGMKHVGERMKNKKIKKGRIRFCVYSQLGERKREISSGPFFSFFLRLIVTRDYAWLGESSAKKKKKKKKKRFVFFFLCSFFFLFSSSSPFSFFLFISFSCHQDSLSLSPLQLFFLPQHIIRGQGSWKRVPYTFVRFPFSFIELTAGLAPFVLFILFFLFIWSQKYLTWSIFLSFALLRIWVFLALRRDWI